MKYGILRYPHQNARYFEATKHLLVSELRVMMAALKIEATLGDYERISGVELYCFEIDDLTERALTALLQLSANYILFEIHGNMLKPLNESKCPYFNKDLSSILKYSGKTNEDFTGMMINVGIFSSKFAKDFKTPLQILDPMCGRGTTLYQGLIMGYNVSGIEINAKECEEINNYLKRYLKYNKYKHEASHQTIVIDKKKKGKKYTIETADTTENYKKKNRRRIQFASGNTLDANDYYKKDSFHVIATDIPYGVQHSGTSKDNFIDMEKLLGQAAFAWHKVLKRGGAVVISYNNFTLKKDVLCQLFEKAGYTPLVDAPYDGFEHWVEQAVNRDLFVAIKN
jgi:LysM repeat protein